MPAMKVDVLDLDRALTALKRIAATLEGRSAYAVLTDLGNVAMAIDDLCAELGLTRLSHLWGWRAWGVQRLALLDAGTAVAETPRDAAVVATQCLRYPTDVEEIEVYRAHAGGPNEITRTTARAFFKVDARGTVTS